MSAIGDDEAGRRAELELQRRGVDTREVQRLPNQPTARVNVELAADGAPRYSADQRLDWRAIAFAPALSRACEGSDALVFSAFAQRSALDLAALEQIRLPSLVGCDLNLRQSVPRGILSTVARHTDFVKLNEDELERARAILGGEDPPSYLLAGGKVRLVAVTRAANGASLVTREGSVARKASTGLAIRDGVGAGDAFFAGLALALLRSEALDRTLELAMELAERQLGELGALAPGPSRT